jgi:hypothetical protein
MNTHSLSLPINNNKMSSGIRANSPNPIPSNVHLLAPHRPIAPEPRRSLRNVKDCKVIIFAEAERNSAGRKFFV